jgi:hypothetical protein
VTGSAPDYTDDVLFTSGTGLFRLREVTPVPIYKFYIFVVVAVATVVL